VPCDQSWSDADPLAFLPEEIKPNPEYPFFVTTVRYQRAWQSGYTYRWTTDLAKQLLSPEVTVHRDDAKHLGFEDGNWASCPIGTGRRGQWRTCRASSRGRAPPTREPNGEPALYANNLIAGGEPAAGVKRGLVQEHARCRPSRGRVAPPLPAASGRAGVVVTWRG
jgi:hypothetical protein